MRNKILINYTLFVTAMGAFFFITQPVYMYAQVPPLPDLDVSYIERTPRYSRYCVTYVNDTPRLCAGTENNKRWPETGESVTYTAHVINGGGISSVQFAYQWLGNSAVVATGTSPALSPGQEAAISFATTWPSTPENIQFKVDPSNVITEVVETNNALTIGSHDLTISIWVERGLYDIFNNTLNLVGSYSFEDWVQAQFAKMNERFSQAQYPVAPDGIRDRVRIDKLVITEDLNGATSPMNSDPHLYLIDGRWPFTDGDPTNAAGPSGAWQNYVDTFVNQTDWGLVHELAHQLGIIDLYRMNLANDPENNMRVQVKDINGNVIPASQLPTYAWDQILFKQPGIMAGGDTSPHNDGTYFESHTAGGMNAHYNHRRGYYGEYLFDTPTNNYLKILDSQGNSLVGAQVALYQKNATTEYFDNTPEITGTTDTQGVIVLPNRPVTGVITATGHTLRANPFGQINVVGTNGVMLVKVTKDAKEGYGWLFVLDLNLAYWQGATDSATHTVKTSYPQISSSDNVAPAISNVSATNLTANSATITWTTNEPSDSQVEYGTTTVYGNSTPLNTTMTTSHSQILSGLSASTLYHYRVKSRDAAGNLAVSGDFTFTTSAPPDTLPPTISSVTATNITEDSAAVVWTTNEPSDSQVEYGLTQSYGASTQLDNARVTAHSVTLTGLNGGTLYNFRVKSKDAAGNLTVSNNLTFTTPEPQDTILPSVSIATPAVNTSVSGVTTVIANAADNVGVTKVEFFLDGILRSIDITTPYSWNWDTTTAAEGTHTITVKAFDASGNSNSSSVTVVVSNVSSPPSDETLPSVSLYSPSSGLTLCCTVTLAAEASDNVGVAKVEFWLNARTLLFTDTTAPYAYSWDTTGSPNGSYTIAAKAYDTAGNSAISNFSTVTIFNRVSESIPSPMLPGDLREGDLIRGPDGIKVFIINAHSYKRHIFNPAVFNMYGHLKWGNIKSVSLEVLDAYRTSDFYRALGDPRVYSLEEIDELRGIARKRWLNMTAERFVSLGYDWRQIFTINTLEHAYYQDGTEIR